MIRVAARPVLALPRNPLRLLPFWASVMRQRQHLAALDDAGLADIGVTRAEADAEARRPFWDAPDHWQI